MTTSGWIFHTIQAPFKKEKDGNPTLGTRGGILLATRKNTFAISEKIHHHTNLYQTETWTLSAGEFLPIIHITGVYLSPDNKVQTSELKDLYTTLNNNFHVPSPHSPQNLRVQYLTSDPTRASRYAYDAGVNVLEDKTNGAVLTVVVIVLSNKVFYTTEDEVHASCDRNAWWEKDGYSMLVVIDSMGRHATNKSGYDAAVMDLSLVNVIRCTPCYSGGIDAEYGLVYTENRDGIRVTDATKAAKIGIFATPEIANAARSVSKEPWDVLDRTLENVSVLCFAPIRLLMCLHIRWIQRARL